MTEIKALHRYEQVEAAREEFWKWWKEEIATVGYPPGTDRHQKTYVEIRAWRAFLRAKGLGANHG